MEIKHGNQTILNIRLLKAVVRNDVQDIRRLIYLGADVNSEFTVNELINNKFIDNKAITTIKNGETSVDKLANNRSMNDDIIIEIIKKYSYSKVIFLSTFMNKIILSTESKLSSLQIAMMYGWKEAIVELIKKGANPNQAVDLQNITILQLTCIAAIFKGMQCFIFDEEIIQLLFDYGADPNIQDIRGKTFLHYAVLKSDFYWNETLRSMEMQSSDLDILNRSEIRRIENFLINGANPNIKDSYNSCTILFDIIEHDMYLRIQSKLTNLLLDHACTYGTYEDVLKHPEFVYMMQQDYGRSFGSANAKDLVHEFNSKHKQHVENNKQLIEAVKIKAKSKVSALLNEGTSPNIRDTDGLSALHLAVKLGDCAITELLLNKGANPNIKSWKNGTTPLFNAVTSNRIDIAELLLKHSANPSIMNTKRLSPLYFSITNKNEEMTELLLNYNANPDISHQISILFSIVNGIKNDNNIEIVKDTLKKIKDIVEFLKFKHIPVDYSLFYQSVDIAEKNGKKNTSKKVMEFLNELVPLL